MSITILFLQTLNPMTNLLWLKEKYHHFILIYLEYLTMQHLKLIAHDES